MDKKQEERINWTNKDTPVFRFSKGLPGFNHLHEYALKEHNEVFSLLIAVDNPEVAFITVNPFEFKPDYEFVLPDEVIAEMEVSNAEQIEVRCIITWHSNRNKSTVNLLAPIILNNANGSGKQMVLQNSSYTTRHLLWANGEKDDKGGEG